MPWIWQKFLSFLDRVPVDRFASWAVAGGEMAISFTSA